ncbi:polyketide cyclase [Geobacillus stearothermophilus]|nr:polyketide cyclase [Geobacillus stearothermophilus]
MQTLPEIRKTVILHAPIERVCETPVSFIRKRALLFIMWI